MPNENTYLPLVTIITPVYNRGSFLDETITSVLGQSYPNIEYIVLDDGSTDNSQEVIKKYDGRIIWCAHDNMGETRTVNKGFGMAHGEIIGVVNSDDPLLPDAVERIISKFGEDSGILVVYPDWDMIDANGTVIETVMTHNYNYTDMLRWHHCVPGPGTFFRREVVDKLSGRNTQFRYVADFDFWLRAGLLGPFARLPQRLATFRVHPESASVSEMGIAMAEEHIRLVDALFSQPDFPSALVSFKKEAYSSANYIAGCVCGDKHKARKRRYFIQALYLDAFKYLTIYRERLLFMLPVLLGNFYIFISCFITSYIGIKKIVKKMPPKCH